MKYFLLLFHDNYADEFSIDGLMAITGEEKEEIEALLEEVKTMTFSIGTNQEIEYDRNFPPIETIDFKEVDEEQYEFVKEKIGNLGFAEDFINTLRDNQV